MKRTITRTLATIAMTIALLGFGSALFAQEKTEAKTEAKPEVKKQSSFFKVEITIFEVQDGKRVNAHTYVEMVEEMNWATVRMGTRVPVTVGGSKDEGNKIQYMDVGLRVQYRVRPVDNGAAFSANFEISNFALPEGNVDPHTGNPVIRNNSYDVSAFLAYDQPTIVNSSDDVFSNKRTQVEVKVSRVK